MRIRKVYKGRQGQGSLYPAARRKKSNSGYAPIVDKRMVKSYHSNGNKVK